MARLKRIYFSAALLAVAVLAVLVLTFAGSRSEGPIGDFLTGIGTFVSKTESNIAQRLRGPGRAADLEWFDAIRRDRAALVNPDRVLLGAYDNWLPASLEGLMRMETALDRPMPLVHFFTAWGDRPEHRFPRRAADAIWEVGSVPVITWEPWLSTFDGGRHPHLPPADQRDMEGMSAVARGDYDFYLEAWGRDAAAFGHPVMVRFGHEMNDAYRYPWGPHHNRPQEYVDAYRHVVKVVRAQGARNVIWVWSPHIAYDDFEFYYPGHDVVDWVGATVLNYGTVAYWSEWWTFDDIFTRKYERLSQYDKPLMAAEFGTLMAGGERAPWFEQALTRLPQRLPNVKAVLFFHSRRDASITYQAINWSFDEDPGVIRAIKKALNTWPAERPEAVAGESTGSGEITR
jgi:hypothetical protein